MLFGAADLPGMTGLVARFVGLTVTWSVTAWILSALLPWRPERANKLSEFGPRRPTRPSRPVRHPYGKPE